MNSEKNNELSKCEGCNELKADLLQDIDGVKFCKKCVGVE